MTIPDGGSHVWQLDRMLRKGLLFRMHPYQTVHWDLGGEYFAFKVKDRLTAPPGSRAIARD